MALEFPANDDLLGCGLVLNAPQRGSNGDQATAGGGGQTTTRHSFTFDKVFGPTAGQEDVFQEISELVQSALDGHKVGRLMQPPFSIGNSVSRVSVCTETRQATS